MPVISQCTLEVRFLQKLVCLATSYWETKDNDPIYKEIVELVHCMKGRIKFHGVGCFSCIFYQGHDEIVLTLHPPNVRNTVPTMTVSIETTSVRMDLKSDILYVLRDLVDDLGDDNE